MGSHDQTDMGGTRGAFLTTHWSLIDGIKARPDREHALVGLLLQTYWKPVYCYLRRKGRDCVQFTKIAVVVLNQVVRPFTAIWHKQAIEGGFESSEIREDFRFDLERLQHTLRNYTRALADIAQVEDLTALAFDED